jgi:transglutaminase-like putative cysteine protease
MQRVHDTFRYDPKATSTFTPLKEVLKKKAGVCQDFAHAAIAELRRRGFAAGYVGGYLETAPPPGRKKLRGADATHAWYAVYLPGAGWCHFDPTNNVVPGEHHLITAWGRDYGDIAPLKGVVLGGGKHNVDVEVDVWQYPDQVPEDVMNV